jgi:hypothetical protein
MKNILLFSVLLFVTSFCAKAQQPVTTFNTTGPSICDGAAFFVDSNSVSSTSIVWYGGGAILQQGGYSISGLCAGTYMITYTDLLGNSITYSFIISSGSGNPCSGFYIVISEQNETSPGACDGSLSVSAYGGTPVFTYQWSNGLFGSMVNNMCAGSYDCTVVDANGCVATSTGTVGSGNQGDSILVFTTNNYPGVGVIDTLVTAIIDDCTLDYGAVGSASASNITYNGNNSVTVTWNIYDTLGQIMATYTVPYQIQNPATGVFIATLIVYCSQKAVNINTLSISDAILLDAAQLGIENIELESFTVNNPFSDEINISFSSEADRFIVITDLNGKVKYENTVSGKVASIDTNGLSAGIYILSIRENGMVISRKLIK